MTAAPIRWDRLSRYALLAVFGVLLALYIRPSISYVKTWRESHRRHAAVAALQQENQHLRARQRALRDPQVVEAHARRLGLVRPGERAYTVRGLPKGP